MDSDMATRVDKSTASAVIGRHMWIVLADGTVTLRERDSTVQIRLPKSEVTKTVFDFVHGRMTWDEATAKYPVVQVKED